MTEIAKQDKPASDEWGLKQWEYALGQGILPKGLTPGKAFVIAKKGREMGLGPMRSIETIIVISGRASMTAAGMLGLIKERATMQMQIVENSRERACVRVREGHERGHGINTSGHRVYTVEWDDHWNEVEFTQQDAQDAGLWNKPGPWKQYPKAMLWARCISAMARQLFPHIIQGCRTEDEVREILRAEQVEKPEPVHSGPAAVAAVLETRSVCGQHDLLGKVEPDPGEEILTDEQLAQLEGEVAPTDYAQES
jgi:hypothetical protein